MKKALSFILPIIFMLTACAPLAQVRHPAFPKNTCPAVQTGLEITLLPALDSRKYQSNGEFPDLAKGVTIRIPAEDIVSPARKFFLDEGLFTSVKTYTGSRPGYSNYKWSALDLHELKTDLALGLKITRLNMKKNPGSPFMPSRALINAATLPVSALGILISNGHFDLGGWLVPAGEILYTLEVEVNVYSLKGMGLIFNKTYIAHKTDTAVSDKNLFKGFYRSKQDGQNLGRTAVPALREKLFSQICRDPEMAYLWQYVDTAWLGRVLREPRVSPVIKTEMLKNLPSRLLLPTLTAAQVKALAAEALSPPGKTKMTHDLKEEAARIKLLERTCKILLSLAGELNRKKMQTPLTEDEKNLMSQTMAILGRLGQNKAANQFYRARLRSPESNLFEKKCIALLLSQALEVLDNEEFINREIKARVKALKQGSAQEKQEAAAVLITLEGPAAVKKWAIDRTTLLKVLSSDDRWAVPVILKELKRGNFNPEILRLSGALKSPPAMRILLATLKKTLGAYKLPPPEPSPERPVKIPLYPTPQKKPPERKGPDPVLIVRVLGCYNHEPLVKKVLRDYLADILSKKETLSGREALTAEVIKSLGRIEDQDSQEAIFEIWSRKWPRLSEAHLLRRNALRAMADLGDKKLWKRILNTVQKKISYPSENQAVLREVADFFGEVRYDEAVPFLVKLINHPETTDLILKTCFQALSRIATPKAESQLKILSHGPNWYLSQKAVRALEGLTLERALWENLKGVK